MNHENEEFKLNEARMLLEQNQPDRAKSILDEILLANSLNLQALIFRGRANCKMQQWGDAMNDYSAVTEIDPDHAEGRSGLAMVRNILEYYTPDMFNP